MNRGIIIAATLLVVACSERERPVTEGSRLQSLSADSLFYAVEQLLITSDENIINFEITAEGAYEASLVGVLTVRAGNRVQLSANGTFGSDSADLELVSDGALMRYGNGESIEEPTPAELNRAIIVGMTRMGLLHNLARLVSNAPPDHASGGVTEWVRVQDLTKLSTGADPLGVAFTLVVDGEPSGTATLEVDDTTGESIVRRQTVAFPDGEMRVTERYRG